MRGSHSRTVPEALNGARPAGSEAAPERRLNPLSWLRAGSAVLLGFVLSLAVGAPASAHTVVWNEFSYTTPITDYADGVNMCAPVTAWFGQGGHTGGQYYAIDIGLPSGTPIYSPKGGYAWYQWNTGGGNMVNIRHPESGGSMTTVLAHLSSVRIPTDGVARWVNKNVIIGYSGASGQVTGPHLHWQMNVSDHMNDGAYGANLDLIPGVEGGWSPRRVCGVEH
ncbi:MAG: M23 family metallopeptidase [Micromonosporaceae bacterium]